MILAKGSPPLQKLTRSYSPDTEFVVFHGNEHESREVELSGKVVLNTPDSLNFKAVKVVLEGKRKVSYVVVQVYKEEKHVLIRALAGLSILSPGPRHQKRKLFTMKRKP